MAHAGPAPHSVAYGAGLLSPRFVPSGGAFLFRSLDGFPWLGKAFTTSRKILGENSARFYKEPTSRFN